MRRRRELEGGEIQGKKRKISGKFHSKLHLCLGTEKKWDGKGVLIHVTGKEEKTCGVRKKRERIVKDDRSNTPKGGERPIETEKESSGKLLGERKKRSDNKFHSINKKLIRREQRREVKE